MPVAKTQQLGPESSWALWLISENEQELSFAAMESCPEDVISPQKRLEFLAGRTLIKSLAESVGITYQGIRKDDHGKPFLKGHPHQISMSHSFPWVAAQIDRNVAVGIDVEQPKPKLLNIAARILSKEEFEDAGDNVVKHCVYWCAKEAMYKIYGKRGLHFNSQLNVEPFVLNDTGVLKGKISAERSHRVSLAYEVQQEFVFVFTQP
jgi:phosphopantetheinyl transferase